jgi:hypothetical protein
MNPPGPRIDAAVRRIQAGAYGIDLAQGTVNARWRRSQAITARIDLAWRTVHPIARRILRRVELYEG